MTQKQSEAESLYAQLAAPFDVTFGDTRGGVRLTYITGEQVVSRLNQVLGVTGWSFSIVHHGIDEAADEVWVLGELVIYSHATQPILLALVTEDKRPTMVLVRRQQFGSQKLKRKRADKTILDIGFDLKGAATDALKKCASQVGVGLYLTAKEGGDERVVEPDPAWTCSECGVEIMAKRFADGSMWTVQDIVERSERINDEAPLCFKHLKVRLQPASTNGRGGVA